MQKILNLFLQEMVSFLFVYQMCINLISFIFFSTCTSSSWSISRCIVYILDGTNHWHVISSYCSSLVPELVYCCACSASLVIWSFCLSTFYPHSSWTSITMHTKLTFVSFPAFGLSWDQYFGLYFLEVADVRYTTKYWSDISDYSM